MKHWFKEIVGWLPLLPVAAPLVLFIILTSRETAAPNPAPTTLAQTPPAVSTSKTTPPPIQDLDPNRTLRYWFLVAAVLLGLVAGVNSLVGVWRETEGGAKVWWASVYASVRDARQALIIGGSLAAAGCAIHLLYTKGGPVHDQYDAAIGIYLTALTASLGVRAFYSRIVPITDVNTLLRMLTRDLRSCHSGPMWLVYPALNIGYYRNYRGEAEPEIMGEFKDAISKCAKRLSGAAYAITYPTGLYEPLYKCYHESQRGQKPTRKPENIVRESAEYAKIMLEQLRLDAKLVSGGNAPTASGASQTYEIEPGNFPPHVILIGDITYVLLSYGFPIYDKVDKKFQALPGENELIDVLAYRREDSALTKMISKHLGYLVAPKNVNIAPSTALAISEKNKEG